MPAGKPWISTGKSELFLTSTPHGEGVVKILKVKREPWKSLFLHEAKTRRALARTPYDSRVPALLEFRPKKFTGVWEKAEGRPLGVGRFFPRSITSSQTQGILKGMDWIRRVKPAVRGCEFSHGDLVSSNILWSPRKVTLVDWEHAGMRQKFFDLAFVWVMGLFSEAHRRQVVEVVRKRRGLKLFWLLAVDITAKEIRIHEDLRRGSGYRSEESLSLIRTKLRDSYIRAIQGI